jgi:hypothetical protein
MGCRCWGYWVSYAIMGSVLCAVLLAPLGLARYGLALGFFLGLQARLTRDGAPDPAGWTREHAQMSRYRLGAAVIAGLQVVLTLGLAVAAAALLVGRQR